jgi:HSP20 family molecular chaperone IbpA
MGSFHKEFDFGIDLDKIIETAKEFGERIKQMAPEMRGEWFDHCRGPGRPERESGQQRWYSYPPANIYTDADMNLVMEFDLAGMDESTLSIAFQGDYLVLDAKAASSTGGEFDYSRHGFRPRDIRRQKYLAPAEDYAHDKAKAVLKRGVLTVTIPPKDFPDGSGVRVEIIKEGK